MIIVIALFRGLHKIKSLLYGRLVQRKYTVLFSFREKCTRGRAISLDSILRAIFVTVSTNAILITMNIHVCYNTINYYVNLNFILLRYTDGPLISKMD